MVTTASQPSFSPSAARADLRSARIAGLRNQATTPQGAQAINADTWTPDKDQRRLRQLTQGLSLPASLSQAIQEAESALPEESQNEREFERSRLLSRQQGQSNAQSLASGLANRSLDTARSKLKGMASAKKDALQKEAMEKMKKLALEKTSRWGAKLGGHGLNAIDIFGEDAWFTYVVTYIYDWCRAVVTILVPEPTNEADQLMAAGSKGIRFFIPPYRLTEPGDLLYFIGEFIITMLILVLIIAVLAAIYVIFTDPLELLTLAAGAIF
ncbi:hypothetical protein KBC55_04185 [Patescibacteria group bacterium]|nr:hypothetical protein [Patescibacteria group bacterium]